MEILVALLNVFNILYALAGIPLPDPPKAPQEQAVIQPIIPSE